jgi:hypothetical protein
MGMQKSNDEFLPIISLLQRKYIGGNG